MNTLVSRFNSIVNANSSALAVSDVGGKVGGKVGVTLTYHELSDCSNALANGILQASTEAAFVGICTAPDKHFIMAVLAVLKAGKGWVYIDPGQPLTRLNTILDDAGTDLLVVSADCRPMGERLGTASGTALRLLVIEELVAGENAVTDLPETQSSPSDPACLLYTSGSMGTPKGVIQTHANWLHVVNKATATLGLGSEDRIAMISPPGHVVGVAGMMMALMTGASVHMFNLASLGFVELASWIRQSRISYFHTVPMVFRRLVVADHGDSFESVRMVAIGGELVTREDVSLFFKHFPSDTVLRNSYGATEAIDTFQYLVSSSEEAIGPHLPIGKQASPLDKLQLRDRNGNLSKNGEPGEICIESPWLSPGYWNNPVATAEKFFHDPDSGRRVYRSGDWGYIDDDGQLNYLSRFDDQVKVRGHRVELTEIEKAFRSMPTVKDIAIRSFSSPQGETRLAAYVVPVSGNIRGTEFKHALGKLLPDYMVPEIILTLEELPQNANGKIDRARLPDPFAAGAADYRYAWVWQEQALPEVTPGSEPHRVLLLTAGGALGDAVLEMLQASSMQVSIVQVPQAANLPSITAALSAGANSVAAYDSVVCTLPQVIEPGTGSFTQASGFRQAFELPIATVRWIHTARSHSPPQLVLVTEHAVNVSQHDGPVSPAAAAVHGLLRSIPRDFSSIQCRLVDLDGSQASLDVLAGEILNFRGGEISTAIRHGLRMVARLKVSETPAVPAQPDFSGGTCLVTGGLGSLGMAVARKLADTGTTTLFLIGRSAPDEATGAAIRFLSQQGVDVQTRQVDMCDADAVTRLMVEICARFPPLKGIFHLAGTHQFQLLQDYDWETFRTVLSPKVDGAWNLHAAIAATGSTQPVCFVAASSVSALFGFTGHAAYCAANSFMDGLASLRNFQGHPSLSINLGTLDGGMADSETVQNWVASDGLMPMPPDEAASQVLDLIVHPSSAHALVAKIDAARLLRSRPDNDRRILEALVSAEAMQIPDIASRRMSGVLDKETVVNVITESWRCSLRLQDIPPDANFFDLGGDSLALIECQLALSEAMDCPVSVADISDNPTVKGLTRFLMQFSDSRARPNSVVSIRMNAQDTRLVFINSTREARLLAGLLPETVDVCSANLFRLSAYFQEQGPVRPNTLIHRLADVFAEDLYLKEWPSSVFLFGFCQDALLTVEVARRLLDSGNAVKGIFLLDALFHKDVTYTLKDRWTTVREVGPRHYIAHYVRRLPGAISSRLKHGLKPVPRYISSPAEKAMYDHYRQEAFIREPEPLPVVFHHLVSSQWRLQRTTVYERIAQAGFQTLPVRGSHQGVWDSPFIEKMSNLIEQIILQEQLEGADKTI